MPTTVTAIRRYPVKGLSADPLDAVALEPGKGMPHDRRFALALASTFFDPRAPQWLSKTSYLMLMRNERLAQLRTRFDADTGFLTITREGASVAHARITEAAGRAVIEDFFLNFMGDEIRGRPHLVEAPAGFMFSDTANCVVSLNSLASLRALEEAEGRPVDPVRFRGNICFDGAPAWAEFDWVDREIEIGTVRLRVTKRIDRCAATNVDPQTARRDMNLPQTLRRSFGHVDFGVYAKVLTPGTIRTGDALSPAG